MGRRVCGVLRAERGRKACEPGRVGSEAGDCGCGACWEGGEGGGRGRGEGGSLRVRGGEGGRRVCGIVTPPDAPHAPVCVLALAQQECGHA